MKFSELATEWLRELGYTHCFFVAGGAMMHLLDGVRTRFTCIPVVHEVAAGIAAEYFNETSPKGRAFALVTAGPGVSNIITAMSGAFLESRELLVIAGQVKSADLATDGVRQRGIQEIDGRALAAPVSVRSVRIERPVPKSQFIETVLAGRRGRNGPVFIEICLDAQGAPVDERLNDGGDVSLTGPSAESIAVANASVDTVAARIKTSARPVFLIGGGITHETAREIVPQLVSSGIPLMTTWNGADRVGRTVPTYVGRPNTWGQRSANVLLRQADVIVAFGTRLGLQQTGFNWQEFGADAFVVQAELDEAELKKGHPRVDLPLACDANTLLRGLAQREYPAFDEWLTFCRKVRDLLPLDDPKNQTHEGFVSPFRFYMRLAEMTGVRDVIVPCSSGGANSTAMQAFEPVVGQRLIVDKGLASMGYGLSGAIGAAFANPDKRVILVEGDGGFVQNLQELATADVNGLNIKMFIFSNDGYASIRTTQRNYFNGAYLGCDVGSGLGFPNWETLFAAFNVPCTTLGPNWSEEKVFNEAFSAPGPQAFLIPIDPEQTYFPKITSRVTASGSMESNPLHLMSPDLDPHVAQVVFRYLQTPALS